MLISENRQNLTESQTADITQLNFRLGSEPTNRFARNKRLVGFGTLSRSRAALRFQLPLLVGQLGAETILQ